MLYFKHSELANNYHVSLKTVHNWIDSAKQGKLELKLVEKGSRTYVANTSGNGALLEKLEQQGKKFRNVRFQKAITPANDFYKLYSRTQVLDIITSLTVNREVPRQYNYFDGGADYWDKYATKMWESDTPSLTRSSSDLLTANLQNLDTLLDGYSRVNIVDIGPGNALPSKAVIEHLHRKDLLHRYIALDISETMLAIVEKNIQTWFGGEVSFEGHLRDMTFEKFDDLLVDDMLESEGERTVNVVLFLGATPMTSPDPYDMLRVIRKSLSSYDLLVYTDAIHSEHKSAAVDVNTDIDSSSSTLSPKYGFILGLLGIDKSLYDVEMKFNNASRIYYIQVRLNSAISIVFKFDRGERVVNFDKGEAIILWHAWYQTASEIITGFGAAGFTLLQASITRDSAYMLTISGIDAGSLPYLS
jgi:uncharacterized SAM-dependent methyltransferase